MTGLFLALVLGAPVPAHLMREPAPVGTVFPYGDNHLRVLEVRAAPGTVKRYRVGDVDPRNEWRGWWVREADLLRTLADRQVTLKFAPED
jgi:hypothetical protein